MQGGTEGPVQDGQARLALVLDGSKVEKCLTLFARVITGRDVYLPSDSIPPLGALIALSSYSAYSQSISVFIVRLPLMVSSLVLLVAAVQISPRVVGDLRVKVLRHHESDAHCGVFSENNQKALFHLTYTVTGSPLFETASLVCNDPRHFAAKSISDMKKAAKFSRGESEMADAVLNTLEARTIKKLPSNANKGKTCKQRLLDFYKYNENAIKKTTTGLCGPIEDAGCMFTYYMCGEALTIYNKMESEPKPPTFKGAHGNCEFRNGDDSEFVHLVFRRDVPRTSIIKMPEVWSSGFVDALNKCTDGTTCCKMVVREALGERIFWGPWIPQEFYNDARNDIDIAERVCGSAIKEMRAKRAVPPPQLYVTRRTRNGGLETKI